VGTVNWGHNDLDSQHNDLDSQHNDLDSQHNDLDSQHNDLDSQHNDNIDYWNDSCRGLGESQLPFNGSTSVWAWLSPVHLCFRLWSNIALSPDRV
jgi:hypothetical protein